MSAETFANRANGMEVNSGKGEMVPIGQAVREGDVFTVEALPSIGAHQVGTEQPQSSNAQRVTQPGHPMHIQVISTPVHLGENVVIKKEEVCSQRQVVNPGRIIRYMPSPRVVPPTVQSAAAAIPSPECRIPRPPNAFMLFANENRRGVAAQYPSEGNRDISVRLGRMWKTLDQPSKDRFYALAKKADYDHKIKYPGYVYNPKEARLRKALRLKSQEKARGASGEGTGEVKEGQVALSIVCPAGDKEKFAITGPPFQSSGTVQEMPASADGDSGGQEVWMQVKHVIFPATLFRMHQSATQPSPDGTNREQTIQGFEFKPVRLVDGNGRPLQ